MTDEKILKIDERTLAFDPDNGPEAASFMAGYLAGAKDARDAILERHAKMVDVKFPHLVKAIEELYE